VVIDQWDIRLAERDPENNSLEMRSVRILDDLIAKAERELVHLKFVRETIQCYQEKKQEDQCNIRIM
jgi:hypothetical protein